MECIPNWGTEFFVYVEPQANTSVYESRDKKLLLLYSKKYFCAVTNGPSIENMCNMIFYFNTQS